MAPVYTIIMHDNIVYNIIINYVCRPRYVQLCMIYTFESL